MPATGSPSALRSLQGKRAAARRWHSPDGDALDRDFAAAKLEDYIKRTIESAPPLTPAQRDKLALLLRDSGSGA